MSQAADHDRTCNVCGTPLCGGALGGLCPKCLLRLGFEGNAERHLRICCPQCQVAIEIVDDASLREVTCPSCDTRFSLVGDQTATHVAEDAGSVGRFELIDRIGVGAFGTVWKARDPELDRTVAVKIPRKEQLSEDEAEQFLREARSAAQLKHPGIVSVHEVGRDGGRIYIVSDFIEGVTLADALSAQRPSIRDSAELCRLVAEALQHAHENGVIHRDLKPSNIMLDDAGQPHVMDFGLAKREAAEITITLDGRILGTPAYMSPEQARGEGHHADARSDVYSLGVILFELLTGEKPFRGTSRMLLHQVLKEDAPSPCKLNSSIPRDLETICLKCLEKAPAGRYQSARAMAEELQRYLRGEPIHARPITTWEHAGRWCRRNPVIASLTAALLAVFAAGFVGVALQWIRAERFAKGEKLSRQNAEKERDRADTEAARARRTAHEARQAAIRADMAAERASAYLYATRMNLAQQAWNDGHVDRAVQILEAVKPANGGIDRRGFEWSYLARLCDSHLAGFAMDYGVKDLAFSPDGRLLAAAGYTQVKVWSVSEKKRIHEFKMRGAAQCVAFSPDSRKVASAEGIGNLGYVSTIVLWNTDSGEKTQLAKCDAAVGQLAFSPDGTRLAGALTYSPIQIIGSKEEVLRSGEIKVWSSSDGKELYSIVFTFPNLKDRRKVFSAATEAPVHGIAFSPDGSQLAGVTGFGRVLLWDATDGHQLLELAGGATHVVFGPDGRTITSGGTTWNVSDGSIVSRRLIPSTYLASDGKRAAAADGRVITVWNIATQEDIATIRGHTSNAYRLAISPDGWRIASAASKDIRIWDAHANQESFSLTHVAANPRDVRSPLVKQVALSSDGRRIATAVDGGISFLSARIRVWDRISGQQLLEISDPSNQCMNLEFSPDGSLLAAAFFGEGTAVWNSRSGELLHRFKNEGRHAVFSPDGKTIATAGGERRQPQEVVLRNVSTGKLIRRLPETWYGISRLAFSPDGLQLAVGANKVRKEPNSVTLWEVANGRQLKSSSVSPIQSMAYSPDGDLLAIGSRTGVKVFNSRTLEEVATLDEGALHIAFGPDGRRLLTGANDVIRVWDVDSWQEVLRLRGAYTGLSFDAAGEFLAAGGMGVATIWDIRPRSSGDAIEREAVGVVRFLAAQRLTVEEAAKRIRDDRTIGNAVREHALSYLDSQRTNEHSEPSEARNSESSSRRLQD